MKKRSPNDLQWPRPVARHLFQGDHGYYCRLAVPVVLRPIIGKREFWAAIHATSDAGAVRRLPAVVARFQAVIDTARAEAKSARAQNLSPRQGQALSPRQSAVAHYDGELALDDQMRNAGLYDPSRRDWSRAGYVAALRRVASGAVPDDECAAVIGWAIDTLVANGNVRVQPGSIEWRALARQQAAIQLEVEKRKDERDRGEGELAPRHPLLTVKPAPVAGIDPMATRILGPDSEKLPGEIVHDFIKERKPTDKIAYGYIVTVRLFEEVLGEAKPIYRITRGDVLNFKRALQDLPANHTKRFPGLSVLEAIKENKARAVPFEPLNTKTINNKYLSGLRSVFNWCFENEVLPDNPAAGVRVVATKESVRKAPFSPGDLAKIFSAERFQTRPFDETQWAMLISLFTGMRAAEVAQMKLDSVRTERGVLVFAVEEKTKTNKSRLIPVHSILVVLGLNERVTALRAKSATHLLPDWYQKGAAKRNWSAFIPDAFNDTTKKNLGITGRKSWHSFRHCFTTGLDHAGVDDAPNRALCGHTDQSAHAGYIHGHAVEAMKDAIEKLRFDGFTLGA